MDKLTHTQSSIFYDREEPYFHRWLADQGLSQKTPDHVVVDAMRTYLEANNAVSISRSTPVE